MKVLITGSRGWRDVAAVREAIVSAKATIVVEGSAPGADLVAERVAKDLEIPYRGYPAKWRKLGRVAGAIRNRQMLEAEHRVDEPIDLVLAFPAKASIGTLDMMEIAEAAGIKVIVDTRAL